MLQRTNTSPQIYNNHHGNFVHGPVEEQTPLQRLTIKILEIDRPDNVNLVLQDNLHIFKITF